LVKKVMQMAEPKIRFKKDGGGSYPTWTEYSISDLFIKIGTKNKNCENTNVITNSAEFGLIPQRDYFDKDIAVEGKTDNYTIIHAGDFVYNPRKSSYAPMGPFNCYRLEEDGIVSPLYSCLRPKGILNPEYLLWYFQTDKWYGYVNDHGAQNGARHDRVGMTDKILMGIPVSAPCDEEQQKIADFLSSVDEIIAASEEEVANLEKQKQAVMKKIFSQEMRFKSADGSIFPEWDEQELGAVAFVKVGSMPDQILEAKTDFEYINAGTTNSGYVNGYNREGDVTTTPSRGQGGIGFVGYQENAFWLGPLCYGIQSRVEQVLTKYLYFYLDNNTDYIMACVKTGSIPAVNKEDLVRILVQLPCLEEQCFIVNNLSNFDEAISAAKKELELWKELKKGLLQQMFV